MGNINTLIINKILVHFLDQEHKKVHTSQEFAALNDTTRDYYRKRVEKALNSNQLKELTVTSLHELLLRGEQMAENDENFKIQAKEISERFFNLGSHIEAMPNANIIYVDCYRDGVHMIAALKVDYKYVPVCVFDDDNVRIVQQQLLPTAAGKVDEAIVMDVDNKKLWILEKKYLIDGKMATYLNAQWIKGEENLTDRQKFNTMKKVVNKMDSQYHVSKDTGALPLMKQEINEKVMNNEEVKPYEIVQKILEKDYQASEESGLMLKDLGIDERSVISIAPTGKTMETCKLVTDNDIEIQMPVDDYVAGLNIEQVHNPDGTTSIILKNINEIVIK